MAVPIVLALGCALAYGIADYCGGRASRSAPSTAVTAIGQVTSLVLAVVVVTLVGTAVASPGQLAWGATAGVATAFALASFYHALSLGSMAVVAPIAAVLSAVLPIGFGLVRGERPSPVAYVGMALALAAVALVSGFVGIGRTGPRGSATACGYAAVAGVGFALIFVALGQTTDESGVWPLVAARLVTVALMVGVLATQRVVRVPVGRSILGLAVGTGVLDIVANVLFLLAARRGLLSIVVVIAALYPVSTVILALALDRERVSRSQAAGMAMAVGALVLVSISGAT
ncbi:MAG: EamA family transporter [Ilumatobacteraceae bacterium]